MGGLRLRKKVSLKCECGKAIAEGSVFCPNCRAKINRKNAQVIKNEERNYQKKMRSSNGRAKKK